MLQGKCPAFSREDCSSIESQVDCYGIFSGVHARSRHGILARLRLIDRPIPSIHTFLEDIKYLEPCAKIMKALLPPGFRGSVETAFRSRFDERLSWMEQVSEDEAVSRTENVWAVAYKKAYQQLWLYTMRHFPEMIGQCPRKDHGRPKPQIPAIEQSWWNGLSSLAADCGFVSLNGSYANRESADLRMARDFLRQARPDLLYEFDAGSFDTEVQRICGVLTRCKRRRLGPEDPKMSTDRDVCGNDIAYRCGRPFESSFLDDRQYLFLRHMDCNMACRQKRYITSFAVIRAMFKNFFEAVDESASRTPTSGSQPGVQRMSYTESSATESQYSHDGSKVNYPLSVPVSPLEPSHPALQRTSHTYTLGSISQYSTDSPRIEVPLSACVTTLEQDTESPVPDPSHSLTILRWSPKHPDNFEPQRFNWNDRKGIQESTNDHYLLTCEDMKFVSPMDMMAKSAGNEFIKTKESCVAHLKEFYEQRHRRTRPS